MLRNIDKTVLSQPKFFKKRIAFFNIISVIWINDNDFEYTYNIYALLIKNLEETDSILSLLKFMCDITGLLQPLDNH